MEPQRERQPGGPGPQPAAARWLALLSWCAFDWANSSFPTVITTFVFAAFFAKKVAVDPIAGTSQWAYAMSLSALAIALASPPLGAIADAIGRHKPWVGAFTLVCVGATALLWFARPGVSMLPILLCAALANFAFEMSTVFYNAMLPDLAPPGQMGRLSGWGWGLGYAGGLVCLLIALVTLVQPDPPLFGLDAAAFEPVRATALLVAVWFGLFSLPLFLFTPDMPATGLSWQPAVRQGIATLATTVRILGSTHRPILLYLIAHMLYADGLTTLFAVGGIYAAVTFGMDFRELLLFGISLNITAGIGAFAFGWVDDAIGPKRTIVIALGAIIAIGLGMLFVEGKTAFWALAVALGIFFGPAQSASRSLMAKLAPVGLVAETFGLYALAGKATAFLGPAVFGWVTGLFHSQRAGLATVLVFLLTGLLLLLPVQDPALREER
jgi:UMF1 family MFS transporter